MSALAIIDRELRVRARRPWTTWMRVVVGLIATLIAFSTLSWAQYSAGTGPAPGQILFNSLSILAFIFCLVEGVRQTSDCLSEERREGTLGLLFLTRLSGFDVVLGKLAVTSLGSFYSLLAVFPALALALPAGGVSAGEFWRMQLVLLATLFLALACGMWASARRREEGRALIAGLTLTVAFVALPPLVNFVLSSLHLPTLSPAELIYLSGDTGYRLRSTQFWISVPLIFAAGWLLLFLAGRQLALSRMDEEPKEKSPKISGERIPAPPVQPLGDQEPAGWLAARAPKHRALIWVAVTLIAFGNLPYLLFFFWPSSVGYVSGIFTAMHWVSGFLPPLLLAIVASRMLAEGRRGGAMELLLSTPLTPEAIIRGHWLALRHQLSVPVYVCLGLFAATQLVQLASASSQSGMGTTQFLLWQVLPVVINVMKALAVCWLGLYLGLRTRNSMAAVSYNLLWNLFLPMIGQYAFWIPLQLFMGPASWGTNGPPIWFYLIQLLTASFSVVWSVGVIRWSRGKLRTRLRELAAAN